MSKPKQARLDTFSTRCQRFAVFRNSKRPTLAVETPITPTVSTSIPEHQQMYEMEGSDEWTFSRGAIANICCFV